MNTAWLCHHRVPFTLFSWVTEPVYEDSAPYPVGYPSTNARKKRGSQAAGKLKGIQGLTGREYILYSLLKTSPRQAAATKHMPAFYSQYPSAPKTLPLISSYGQWQEQVRAGIQSEHDSLAMPSGLEMRLSMCLRVPCTVSDQDLEARDRCFSE